MPPASIPRSRSVPTDTSFSTRHIGTSDAERTDMLASIGVPDVDSLIDAAVPAAIRDDDPLDLPTASSESDVLARAREISGRNRLLRSFIGLGFHGTVTPPVIRRNILEEPGWYTAYTPYQPEISQGRLEALLIFQTVVSDLTGFPLANASLLDEATAAAEAVTLLHRVNERAGDVVVVDPACHPQTIEVVRTRLLPLGLDVVAADPRSEDLPVGTFGVLLQNPTTTGELHDDRDLIARIRDAGALVAVATDLLALTSVTPPGELGADVAIGTSQRFGVPLGFGGPHAGFIATREEHKRALPGRLVGVSIDTEGRPGYRLALQTREQHIRRERATSNICTSQVLLAVIAAMYAVYHGPDGLRRIAERVNGLARALATGMPETGGSIRHERFFDTLAIEVPGRADRVIADAADAGYNLRRLDGDTVVVALDETTTTEDVASLLHVFGADDVDVPALASGAIASIPPALQRSTDFLTHPVFHDHRSETEMLRYLRRLRDRDVALDRAMIPLGSCTMKLNATAEMEPISYAGFADLHPFVPAEQADGYRVVIEELEAWLVEITGYDAISLQPNAGSQGELAGLLAIAGYHHARGDAARDVCLIPSSAHGTNAASAVMAGMRVVVVACDDDGNVDVDDLKRKVTEHADQLSTLMVTYPSTHGVFESRIREICALVHDHGGQVYLDGANLNALVGIARPGRFGADVSHLNLHKTFCIPHGGGGPGVGPVACGAHLAPYLPNHPLRPEAGPETGPGPVASAPWGSAGILPISWAYVQLMGPQGLRRATEAAILHANYIAHRLEGSYPVLYRGENGFVAHECILDVRGIRARTGIGAEDVAKRLIDYGFHAPTMSFPVEGTLMVEPTESESLAELDRFCDAMIAIRAEIDRVEAGEWPRDDNPLVRAPHTAEDLLTDTWNRPYRREVAAYPVASLRRDKYWPPVSRIDQAYGDRNLVCACPPPEAFDTSGHA
ncbi:MAG: aminomethyl-transferring glycine dehydrogenase [Actinobacteria bacterium]|nr:aminomethyl-transferring glycine dehydrogenase [Actinomycetota bacterium]